MPFNLKQLVKKATRITEYTASLIDPLYTTTGTLLANAEVPEI